MTDHAPDAPIAAPTDDFAAAFQIEGWPVRGRPVSYTHLTLATICSV